jgi:hypothetical protein
VKEKKVKDYRKVVVVDVEDEVCEYELIEKKLNLVELKKK